MNSRNQARVFEAKDSYFEPPENLNSKNQNSEKNISLSQAIEDFKLRSKVEGRADKTLDQYNYVFDRFLEQFRGDSKVNVIEAREIRKYLAYLLDDGLKKTSVAIHYRNLNSLFNWLVNYIFQVPNYCRKLLPKLPTPPTPINFRLI